MLELIYERIKGIILKPVETFRTAANDEISFTFVYFFILLAVFGILFSLTLSQFGMFLMMNNQIIILILTMLGQMILSFLAGTVWLHVWVYLLGGRQGLKNTFRAVSNSMTPTLLLGWIMPMGMIVGMIWGLVLEVMGLRELQKFTTTRAILAVAIPLIIGISLFIVCLAITDPRFLASLTGIFQGH